jgi:hypothetical protein
MKNKILIFIICLLFCVIFKLVFKFNIDEFILGRVYSNNINIRYNNKLESRIVLLDIDTLERDSLPTLISKIEKNNPNNIIFVNYFLRKKPINNQLDSIIKSFSNIYIPNYVYLNEEKKKFIIPPYDCKYYYIDTINYSFFRFWELTKAKIDGVQSLPHVLVNSINKEKLDFFDNVNISNYIVNIKYVCNNLQVYHRTELNDSICKNFNRKIILVGDFINYGFKNKIGILENNLIPNNFDLQDYEINFNAAFNIIDGDLIRKLNFQEDFAICILLYLLNLVFMKIILVTRKNWLFITSAFSVYIVTHFLIFLLIPVLVSHFLVLPDVFTYYFFYIISLCALLLNSPLVHVK